MRPLLPIEPSSIRISTDSPYGGAFADANADMTSRNASTDVLCSPGHGAIAMVSHAHSTSGAGGHACTCLHMLLFGRDVVREMCQVDAANALPSYTLRVVTRCILFTIQLNQIKFAHPIRLFLRFKVGCQSLNNNCTHDVAHCSLRKCARVCVLDRSVQQVICSRNAPNI